MSTTSERNNSQIYRLDGRNVFIEVMSESFPIGKVRFNFVSYNQNTHKQDKFISLYVNIKEALLLIQDIETGRLKKMGDLEKKKNPTAKYHKPVFTDLGGVSAENLKKRGQSRADNKPLSRQLKVTPGSKQDWVLQGMEGPGEEMSTGLIKPAGKADSQVIVPATNNDLIKMATCLKAAIEGFLIGEYTSGNAYKKYVEERKKFSRNGDSVRNNSQVDRVDGKNVFVEIMSEAFEIGKIRMNFAEYDANTKKQKTFFPIYLDVDEFLWLSNQVLSGELHQKGQQIKKDNQNAKFYPYAYNNLGGISPEKLKQRKMERKDNKALSRQLKLSPGSRQDWVMQGEIGAGKVIGTGLIQPDGQPESRVTIPMSNEDLKKFVLFVSMHLAAYIKSRYVDGSIYKAYAEERNKRRA